MNDPDLNDPVASREALTRFRDDFGRDLLDAACRPERSRMRRRAFAFGVPALVAAAAVALVLVLAGGRPGGSILGASPAEAAVRGLSRSLREGVLVRRSVSTQRTSNGILRTEVEDWTDLATRDQRTRTHSADGWSEYWNPSATERWTRDPALETRDGRDVVVRTRGQDLRNASSEASPVEEVAELERLAATGELLLHRSPSASGRTEVELERRERCFADAGRDGQVCRKHDDAWPKGGPPGLRPVITYTTWWLTDGPRPRILRYEVGTIDAGSVVRRVIVRQRYTGWRVLTPTRRHLELVAVPHFDPVRVLVLTGDKALDEARAAGEVRCRRPGCRVGR